MTEERPPTLEFRDGHREVPWHVAAMLKDNGIETFRYTYKEAIRAADNRMLGNVLGRSQQALIDRHFEENQ